MPLFDHLSEGIQIFLIVSDKWYYHLVLKVETNVAIRNGGSPINLKSNLIVTICIQRNMNKD